MKESNLLNDDLRVRIWRVIGLVALILTTLILTSCGGGTSSSSGSHTASLFVTDDLSTNYQQVLVTIYKVEFEKSSDGSTITAFDDPQGVTYDLRELSGVMAMLTGSSLEPGSYNRVLITVGRDIVLVDNTGTQITPNPQFEENTWTVCSGGQCTVEVPGAVNVIAGGSVILDFDLKQFTYDSVTNTVSAKVVVDADGSKHSKYVKMKDDDYQLKGIIQSTGADSFDLSVVVAKHFSPPSSVITVQVDASTRYECDDDDDTLQCGVSSLTDLQVGMKVEVHGTWDGSVFIASRVEVDEDNDIATIACTEPVRSITDYTNLIVQPEIEAPSYTFEQADSSITVNGMKILLTIETSIKLETGGSDQIVCVDSIPQSANRIEVKYYTGLDLAQNPVNIAYKVEFK